MAYRVRKMNYCYVTVPSRAGQAEKILSAVKDAGVSLLGFTGFPVKGGKAQVDLITDEMARVRRVADRNGWRLSKTKKGFLIMGTDELGAAHQVVKKLAAEKINITAMDAVAAGNGRYGMLLWVKPKEYARAARILKAR